MRRFGGLRALLCRGLKTELPPPSLEGELMETILAVPKGVEVSIFPPPSLEGELMETFMFRVPSVVFSTHHLRLKEN